LLIHYIAKTLLASYAVGLLPGMKNKCFRYLRGGMVENCAILPDMAGDEQV